MGNDSLEIHPESIQNPWGILKHADDGEGTFMHSWTPHHCGCQGLFRRHFKIALASATASGWDFGLAGSRAQRRALTARLFILSFIRRTLRFRTIASIASLRRRLTPPLPHRALAGSLFRRAILDYRLMLVMQSPSSGFT